MRPGWAKEKPINLNPLSLSWMKEGQWTGQGDCLSWAFCLIVVLFKFETLLYLQLWVRCYDSSNTTTPFHRKRATISISLHTAWVSFLPYRGFHCHLWMNTLCLFAQLSFFPRNWEKFLKVAEMQVVGQGGLVA